MGRVTSKGNEMKQPSDMAMLRFEHGGSDLWSNTLLLDYGGAPIIVREVDIIIYKN